MWSTAIETEIQDRRLGRMVCKSVSAALPLLNNGAAGVN
ncbi:uncharacterized protein METZ01_LOCUS499956 [marine metagenome]|uniref:Uncharacterized protein n=1 Tax=marine metagenome TaxID=408172 RepID=A0A383DRF4_9ZZZZ